MSKTPKPNVARERFEEALADLAGSDEWRRWLETRARFHPYSFRNTILIALQRPDATLVMGYGAKDKSSGWLSAGWLSVGRHVRRGEKGIAILAPAGGRKSETVTTEATNVKTGATETVDLETAPSMYFRTVYVFDIAQTDECVDPECDRCRKDHPLGELPCRVLDSDSGLTDLADALAGHAMSEGLEVVREEIPSGANGQLHRKDRRVVVASGLSRDAALKTLIHQLGHWHDLGLEGEYDATTRPDAEIVAESAAYVVASAYGLDTSSYSLGYVAEWAGGDLEKVEGLAERVDKAAGAILTALDSDLGIEQAAV